MSLNKNAVTGGTIMPPEQEIISALGGEFIHEIIDVAPGQEGPPAVAAPDETDEFIDCISHNADREEALSKWIASHKGGEKI